MTAQRLACFGPIRPAGLTSFDCAAACLLRANGPALTVALWPPPPLPPLQTHNRPQLPSLTPQAGLRGINLSGGQRQRLNLARAAYCGGDLILLDNALSAVDHHTAQHIFEHAVRGIFRDKATILVTHQVEFLPQCQKVAIMDGGDMLYFGPVSALTR